MATGTTAARIDIHVTPTAKADAKLKSERESDHYLAARGAYVGVAVAKNIAREAESSTNGSVFKREHDLSRRRSDEIRVYAENFTEHLASELGAKFAVEATISEDITNPLAPKRALVITTRLVS